VIVNRGTASAAEILAGALRDRRGATVVGEATFGKDAVQIPFDLRNGGRLHVVVARWATPDGHTVAEAGLPPDIELKLETNLTVEELANLVMEATG
jgi:carboxyl-terminal processing protease